MATCASFAASPTPRHPWANSAGRPRNLTRLGTASARRSPSAPPRFKAKPSFRARAERGLPVPQCVDAVESPARRTAARAVLDSRRRVHSRFRGTAALRRHGTRAPRRRSGHHQLPSGTAGLVRPSGAYRRGRARRYPRKLLLARHDGGVALGPTQHRPIWRRSRQRDHLRLIGRRHKLSVSDGHSGGARFVPQSHHPQQRRHAEHSRSQGSGSRRCAVGRTSECFCFCHRDGSSEDQFCGHRAEHRCVSSTRPAGKAYRRWPSGNRRGGRHLRTRQTSAHPCPDGRGQRRVRRARSLATKWPQAARLDFNCNWPTT